MRTGGFAAREQTEGGLDASSAGAKLPRTMRAGLARRVAPRMAREQTESVATRERPSGARTPLQEKDGA